MRILATNTNDVAMAELSSQIWHRYCVYHAKMEKKPVHTHHVQEGGDAMEMEVMMPKASTIVSADEGCMAGGDAPVAV